MSVVSVDPLRPVDRLGGAFGAEALERALGGFPESVASLRTTCSSWLASLRSSLMRASSSLRIDFSFIAPFPFRNEGTILVGRDASLAARLEPFSGLVRAAFWQHASPVLASC